jgi:hypothetical protein
VAWRSFEFGLRGTSQIERGLRTAFGATGTNAAAVTLADALTALGRLCLLEYNFDGEHTVTRLPIPGESQTEILKALGVSPPGKRGNVDRALGSLIG